MTAVYEVSPARKPIRAAEKTATIN